VWEKEEPASHHPMGRMEVLLLRKKRKENEISSGREGGVAQKARPHWGDSSLKREDFL